MSPSPETPARSGRYENGWIAINRLIREGGSWSGRERNVLYWNHGDGTFSDVSAVVGLDFPEDGRAFAAFDFDQDGDLDLVLKNRNSPQVRLLRNDLPRRNHSVAFRLAGTKSNRDAVGARLVLETFGRRMTKTVRSGSGFLSQSTRTVYFGLGEETAIRGLTVYWPAGGVETYTALPADHLVQLTEGRGDFRAVPFRPASKPDSKEPPPRATGARPPSAGVWLTESVPAPRLEVRGLDGATRSLEHYRGRPVLLNFWATWCAPCQAELADFQKHQRDFEARGLLPLLVSVEEPGQEATVRRYVRTKGLTFPILLANEEAVRGYSVLLRHLTDEATDLVIPTTFLVNESGEIFRFYLGRTSAEQILMDLGRRGDKLLPLALPFPGRAYQNHFRRNWVQLADSFAHAGLATQAQSYLQHALKLQPDYAEAFDRLGLLHAHQQRWPEALAAHQKAAELRLPGAAVHSHVATALAQLNKLPEAEEAARRARRADPQDAEALRVWAAVTSRQGKPEQALPALQQALQLDPESSDAHYNLGLLYQKMGRTKEATASFRQAVTLDPAHAEALNTLGVIYAEDRSSAQAIELFQRALKARPGFGAAHRNLGLVYAQQGQWRPAEDSFRAALRLEPRDAEALNDLGGVYLKTGRFREALSLFRQAIEEKPQLTQAYLNAARAYVALGEKQNAISSLESLLKVQPQEPTAVEWLRRLKP